MNKIKKILVIILILISILFICSTSIFALSDYQSYDPTSAGVSGTSTVIRMVNPVVGIIKTVGVVLAVIAIVFIGIQYMTGSISERAEYKKKLVLYVIGIVLLVSLTQILGLIISISSSTIKV